MRLRRSSLFVVSCFALFLGLPGCLVAPVVPPTGVFYTDIKAPLDTDVDGTSVTLKSGSSTSSSVLGIAAWGDASISAAAKAGGLSKVHHLDYEYFNFLFVFQTFTLVAYGE